MGRGGRKEEPDEDADKGADEGPFDASLPSVEEDEGGMRPVWS